MSLAPRLLTVVRNGAYTFLQQNRARELGTEFDEAPHTEPASNGRTSETPEVLVRRALTESTSACELACWRCASCTMEPMRVTKVE